jgi:osmoprotectant transport system substrate-binding protein
VKKTVRRSFGAVAGAGMFVAALLGCTGNEPRAGSQLPAPLRIASYDFTENEVLAEIYGQALRRGGLAVEMTGGIGPREIVEPGLEQGQVDFVVDYLGTALDFLLPGDSRTHGAPESVYAALSSELRPRGITALDFADAQDQNGFAVTAQFARTREVSTLSDLGPLANGMVFGGPPECPARRYCLAGLVNRYNLRFKSIRNIPTRAATATALLSGEVDIGLLETTDPRLANGQFRLLADDRGLQPKENIVPLVRSSVLQAVDGRLRAIAGEVTRRLTTQTLIELNRAVEIGGRTPAQAASEWLATAQPSA